MRHEIDLSDRGAEAFPLNRSVASAGAVHFDILERYIRGLCVDIEFGGREISPQARGYVQLAAGEIAREHRFRKAL